MKKRWKPPTVKVKRSLFTSTPLPPGGEYPLPENLGKYSKPKQRKDSDGKGKQGTS